MELIMWKSATYGEEFTMNAQNAKEFIAMSSSV